METSAVLLASSHVMTLVVVISWAVLILSVGWLIFSILLPNIKDYILHCFARLLLALTGYLLGYGFATINSRDAVSLGSVARFVVDLLAKAAGGKTEPAPGQGVISWNMPKALSTRESATVEVRVSRRYETVSKHRSGLPLPSWTRSLDVGDRTSVSLGKVDKNLLDIQSLFENSERDTSDAPGVWRFRLSGRSVGVCTVELIAQKVAPSLGNPLIFEGLVSVRSTWVGAFLERIPKDRKSAVVAALFALTPITLTSDPVKHTVYQYLPASVQRLVSSPASEHARGVEKSDLPSSSATTPSPKTEPSEADGGSDGSKQGRP